MMRERSSFEFDKTRREFNLADHAVIAVYGRRLDISEEFRLRGERSGAREDQACQERARVRHSDFDPMLLEIHEHFLAGVAQTHLNRETHFSS
jgi:hypothetical protein